jgi:hypothetical protein
MMISASNSVKVANSGVQTVLPAASLQVFSGYAQLTLSCRVSTVTIRVVAGQ